MQLRARLTISPLLLSHLNLHALRVHKTVYEREMGPKSDKIHLDTPRLSLEDLHSIRAFHLSITALPLLQTLVIRPKETNSEICFIPKKSAVQLLVPKSHKAY